MKTLTHRITKTTPKTFHVPAGASFDLHDYCAVTGLGYYDFDSASVEATKDAAFALKNGEFLEVSHTD